jgi:hypothetical protein
MSDPLSDFLAREQDAFAELEENGPPPVHVVENGVGHHEEQPAPAQFNGELPNGDSGVDLTALDSGFSPDNAAERVTPIQNGRGPSPGSVGSGHTMRTEEEPEKIKKWRENQKKQIAEKDAAEEKKKEELREQAKKELEQWHAQRKAQLEQRKKQNREREKEISLECAPTPDGASPWEKIAKMVDGGSKTAKGTKDTSRMKSLILECKAEATC